jgi:hypothetical protein
LLEDHRLMPLARRDHEGDGLPTAFRPHVHFGAEATLRAA